MTGLEQTARALVDPGKGILAADESTGTIAKRFEQVGVESTHESRRAYRELLFTTPGIGDWISGAILYDETIRDGAPELLERAGVIPGVKVDTGAKALAGAPGETVTEGLDGLRGRLEDYRALGARFAKWRAIYVVGGETPSELAIRTNAHALGRYAALVQEAGLVPIVEPEVLMDGAHGIERCAATTEAVLVAVFSELRAQRVALEGMLLKPNMVLPGADCGEQVGAGAVAETTLRCLLRAVPAAVPGIVFLSGGQSDEAATAHLDAINRFGGALWQLSFSYGRALQSAALQAWGGEPANAAAAQQAFARRARLNAAARSGSYTATMEREAA